MSGRPTSPDAFPLCGFRNGVYYDCMTGEGLEKAFPPDETDPPTGDPEQGDTLPPGGTSSP